MAPRSLRPPGFLWPVPSSSIVMPPENATCTRSSPSRRGSGWLRPAGSVRSSPRASRAGLVGGLIGAGVAQAAAGGVFAGAARRLDPEARAGVPVYEELVAVVVAGLAIGVPPVSLVVVAGLAFLLVRNRQRGERKYAG